MSDHPIALRSEEHQLIVPIVSAQRPTMVKHNRLAVPGAPVFIVELRAVFRCDECHGVASLGWRGRPAGPVPGHNQPEWRANKSVERSDSVATTLAALAPSPKQ